MGEFPNVPPEMIPPEGKNEMPNEAKTEFDTSKKSQFEVPQINEFEAPQKDEFKSLKDDERFQALYQDASLNYLKTKDAEWFNKNYSGELSPDGYLIDKNGKETNFLPSQNITGGIVEVESQAQAKFTELYPEDAQKYQLK